MTKTMLTFQRSSEIDQGYNTGVIIKVDVRFILLMNLIDIAFYFFILYINTHTLHMLITYINDYDICVLQLFFFLFA